MAYTWSWPSAAYRLILHARKSFSSFVSAIVIPPVFSVGAEDATAGSLYTPQFNHFGPPRCWGIPLETRKTPSIHQGCVQPAPRCASQRDGTPTLRDALSDSGGWLCWLVASIRSQLRCFCPSSLRS